MRAKGIVDLWLAALIARSFFVRLGCALLLLWQVDGAFSSENPTSFQGEWYASGYPEDCGGPQAVTISTTRYVDETLSCTFHGFLLEASTATWNGYCSEGRSLVPTTVQGRLENGNLQLYFDGRPGWSALRRCEASMELGSQPPQR